MVLSRPCSLHRCSIFEKGAHHSGSKNINVDHVLLNIYTLGDMEPGQGRFLSVMCIIVAEGPFGIRHIVRGWGKYRNEASALLCRRAISSGI